jgi:hypothetical protein
LGWGSGMGMGVGCIKGWLVLGGRGGLVGVCVLGVGRVGIRWY